MPPVPPAGAGPRSSQGKNSHIERTCVMKKRNIAGAFLAAPAILLAAYLISLPVYFIALSWCDGRYAFFIETAYIVSFAAAGFFRSPSLEQSPAGRWERRHLSVVLAVPRTADFSSLSGKREICHAPGRPTVSGRSEIPSGT